MNPKVSVVIPAYNKADFTVEAINSVLAQDYDNIEIIVVDDGSTDDTVGHLQCFFLLDKDFNYMHQENKGVSAARNAGIKAATGEYIALLDCDDKYIPSKITVSIDEMKRQKVDMIHNSAVLIDKDSKRVGFRRPRRGDLLYRNHIINNVVVKKEVFDKVGLFDEGLFICADWDMWLRIEEHFKIGYIDFPLTEYRV